jgi:tRNA pseudouridine55 synthase
MRRNGMPVDGLLLLDKPAGASSNAALQQARRLFGAAKAGHTGTLDPLATGLLPVCFGEATKFSGLLLDAEKIYLAAVQLGASTDTGDAQGAVVSRGDPGVVDRAAIDRVLRGLTGVQMQVPPMHSALKHKGRPLYEYARRGETVERAGREITVHELQLVSWEAALVTIRLRVTKGTYVRVIAQQIGERLGCGAHLAVLRRERIGTLRVEDALSLPELERLTPAQRQARLAPVDTLVLGLPRLELPAEAARALLQGRSIRVPAAPQAGAVRAYDADGAFVGVAQVQPDGVVVARRLLSTAAAPS